MTPDRAALLDRILAFDIDGGESALPFVARLARENGWSRPYAERVVAEYRRYVFLAMTAGFPVCPSEDVDAAWHLHLTYTRSYWKRFCGEALGQPLHHEPTKGGPAEADKHLTMYAATLEAYRVAFGHEPPADIWPAADVRFGDDLRHRAVNTARNWVIPKQPVKRVLKATAAGVLLAVITPGCAGGEWNPFDLEGAQFLGFLIPMLVGAVLLGRTVRKALRGPGPQPADESAELSWEQAAYLAGGYPRLTTAAITRLVGCGAAVVEDDTKRLVPGEHTPPGGFTPVEAAVAKALPTTNTRTGLKAVQDAVEAVFSAEATRLEAEGFVVPAGRRAGAGCAAVIPLLLVMMFLAVPRLLMGLGNNKPVGYLLATMVFGGILGLIFSAVGQLRLTRRGEAALNRLRERYAGLRTGKGWDGTRDAALGVALFGTAALAGSSIAYLQTWYPRQSSTGTSGGCGSGCGTSTGSGCSGGDGGGGGGCGGGCGGCGGGGGGGD